MMKHAADASVMRMLLLLLRYGRIGKIRARTSKQVYQNLLVVLRVTGAHWERKGLHSTTDGSFVYHV